MEPEQIRELLSAGLPGCDISVDGSGGKFVVTAVGDQFGGLSAVKRQQRIYSLLNEQIASGAIHAVSMRLFSRDEVSANESGR